MVNSSIPYVFIVMILPKITSFLEGAQSVEEVQLKNLESMTDEQIEFN